MEADSKSGKADDPGKRISPGCVVLIWIDYPEGKKEKNDFSGMVKNAASLSVTLAEEKCIHLVAWYDDLTGKVVMWRVKTVQDACYMT